jgi:digalactosyldiacylglycerol synthase
VVPAPGAPPPPAAVSGESAEAPNDDDGQEEDESYTADSDLSDPARRIWVVTTAALPWRTGTAVNPLLRALYLARGRPKDSVTLLVPWLESPECQRKLYGGQSFERPEDQEAWIREYGRERCLCPQESDLIRIRWWKGGYNEGFGSIFPAEDVCSLVPDAEADAAILEEPEHLNWFRVPQIAKQRAAAAAAAGGGTRLGDRAALGWKAKFRHVVGILHTNYAAYVRQYGMGTSLLTAPALNALSSLVVRAYCHRVIRLSGCLPSLDPAKEVTENVHGVRSEFFLASTLAASSAASEGGAAAAAGAAAASPTAAAPAPAKEGADAASGAARPDVAPVYFIGKLIWVSGASRMWLTAASLPSCAAAP